MTLPVTRSGSRARLAPVLLAVALALTAGACAHRDEAPPEYLIDLKRNTEFDGVNLRLFVPVGEDGEASVSTTEDVYEELPGATPVPGHRARAWTFLRVEGADTSIAHALLSWDPADPGDYLVFGWWALFPNQHPPELSLLDSMQYAIIDGPELDHGVLPKLPAGGIATYAGPAGGLYAYELGSAWGDDEGGYVIDEYQGTVTLTADFEDGTLSGCVGCVGDLTTQRKHFGVFLGEGLLDARGLAMDYQIHLPAASLREDGKFERARVELRHPERTVTQTDGYWGGAVSSRRDADGNPRLVAGVNVFSFEEDDGSRGQFVGSFLGLGDTLRGTEARVP